MKKIFNLKFAVFFILSLSIVVFLFTIIDIDRIDDILKQVNILFILGASGCYLLSNIFKTFRFKIFFSEQKLKNFELFSVVCYHNFFNQIMPARTGELTLIYYLKKICKTEVSKSLHSLLVVRFLDLFIVAVFFLISFMFSSTEKFTPSFILVAVAFGLLSLTAALFINHVFSFGYFIFSRLIRITGISRFSAVDKIDRKLEEISADFESKSVVRKLPMLVFSSILVWFALYTFSFFIIRAFSVKLSYSESILGATASVLTNVLPINSFGSFGTMEAGWVGGYLLVGVGRDVAVVSAFAYHLVNFFTAGFLALACRIILLFLKRKKH